MNKARVESIKLAFVLLLQMLLSVFSSTLSLFFELHIKKKLKAQ